MDYPPPPSYDAIQFQPQSTTTYDSKPPQPPQQQGNMGFYYPPPEPRIINQQPPVLQPPRELTDTEKLYRKVGDRIIYDFEKVPCCPGQPSGLDVGVENQVPTELAAVDIGVDEWRAWIEELQNVQKMSPTITGCMIMFCCPGLMVQSCLCAAFCPISGNHPLKCLPCCYGDWYVGLQKWMDKVNGVLNKHDMHCKLMTYKPHQKAPKSRRHGERVTGKDEKYEMSMLVIATTREESLKLQQESWDHGVNDTCTSGNGRIL